MAKSLFKKIFKAEKPIIAMLHVFEGRKQDQTRQVLEDLKILQQYVDGVIVENYGFGYFDPNNATRETANRLLEITEAVMQLANIPVGINVLPNDYWKAFHIAGSAGARFVQLDHVTGRFAGCKPVDSKELLKIRRLHGEVALLGGIHPKYYRLMDPCTSISESAISAMALCDAVVVTGDYTGGAAKLEDLMLVKHAIGAHPVLVGSGFNAQNAKDQLSIADGAIVGTSTKIHGVRKGEPVDEDMVKKLMKEVAKLR